MEIISMWHLCKAQVAEERTRKAAIGDKRVQANRVNRPSAGKATAFTERNRNRQSCNLNGQQLLTGAQMSGSSGSRWRSG